ncbi:MAG: cell division protein FtsQ [Candidatus Saccharibacteria bacterium]|nr:cell division protein FtsQ [Pseudorhodobacter sp.]
MQSLGRALPLRRDPPPSRWAYRMQRLWLTPIFRVTARVGLPAFVITLAVGIYLSDQSRRDAFGSRYVAVKTSVEQRPEFLVGFMAVDGASPELSDAVRAKLNLKLPMSRFDLDLAALQARAQTLDAVQSAEVKIGAGGVLQVTVTERQPAYVWRSAAGLMMVDASGHRIAGLAERADRADLPLIAGEGADKAVAEATALLRATGPLTPRIRGLVRISDRRWNIVLDRDQTVLLPASDPVDALDGLLALNKAEDIFARDITAIDLRNEHRPVLRLAPYALEELRRAQGIAPITESKT